MKEIFLLQKQFDSLSTVREKEGGTILFFNLIALICNAISFNTRKLRVECNAKQIISLFFPFLFY